VAVERVAPTGDPMWIRIRGFNLSLRKDEAQGILVTPV
jgi:Fe2+ transport system protein FeoA